MVEGVRREVRFEGRDGVWGGFDIQCRTPKRIVAVEGEQVGNSGGVIGWRRECDGGFVAVRGHGDDGAQGSQHTLQICGSAVKC